MLVLLRDLPWPSSLCPVHITAPWTVLPTPVNFSYSQHGFDLHIPISRPNCLCQKCRGHPWVLPPSHPWQPDSMDSASNLAPLPLPSSGQLQLPPYRSSCLRSHPFQQLWVISLSTGCNLPVQSYLLISRPINNYRPGVTMKSCREGPERGVPNQDWDEGVKKEKELMVTVNKKSKGRKARNSSQRKLWR